MSAVNKDLFGHDIIADVILRDKFIEPPFSVLNTQTGSWQQRKKLWRAKGIKSEVGRPDNLVNYGKAMSLGEKDTSIFDPALCEVLYEWFCPKGGLILDPFAGGSVRGIVAHYLGWKYMGIDIRPEQIVSNQEQAATILGEHNQPLWIVGDSNEALDKLQCEVDFVFSCPPYADLEVYSDLPGDISTMSYPQFMEVYRSIIAKSCTRLKRGALACFVVSEVRDKHGYYYGFVPDTIRAFTDAGLRLYNEAVLLNAVGTASARAAGNMKNKKLARIHQNILVFKKP